MPGVVVFQRDEREQVLFTDPETGIREVVVNTTVCVQSWKEVEGTRLPNIVISNMREVEFNGSLYPNFTRHTAGGSVGYFVRG